MGYTTDFEGTLAISPQMKPEHIAYINQFSETRRMKRDHDITSKRPDPLREAVGLPLGVDGGYFVGAGGMCGQEEGFMSHKDMKTTLGVLEYNDPPSGQPGLWCQWVITDDGLGLEWNGGEKFYYYIEWLHYLLDHFLKPWGYVLDGNITWSGEEQGDVGAIVVRNNEVKIYKDFKGMADYEKRLEKEAQDRKGEATEMLRNAAEVVDEVPKHRTLAFYASKTQMHPGAVAFPTPHGVVMIRAEAGLFPHTEEDAACGLHLDACNPLEGETVLNTIDLDEKWSTE